VTDVRLRLLRSA